MVTGLKTVEGAKMTTLESKDRSGNVGIGTDLTPAGGAHEFGRSTPFVFYVHLKKIWWNRKGEMHEYGNYKGAFLDINRSRPMSG